MFNFPTINKLPLFLEIVSLNFLSFFIHLNLAIFASKKKKKLEWLFFGEKEVLKKLKKECIKCNFDTVIYHYSEKKGNIYGVIIDDNFKKIKTYKSKKTFLLSNWLGLYLNKYPIDLIPDYFIISEVYDSNNSSLQLRIKNVSERLVSLILLIITSPIIFFSALLIILDDGFPIFYSQNRNGVFNKTFKITKLRTMKLNAEKDGAEWSKKNDKRITRVGNLIRRIRIDELPQLISVIKGEMALIGPRPERPEIDFFLEKKIKTYSSRYIVKPGLSGWAQVNYPYGSSIEDSKEKFSYDIYYIRNYSNLLDLLILIKTIKMVLNAKGSIPNP